MNSKFSNSQDVKNSDIFQDRLSNVYVRIVPVFNHENRMTAHHEIYLRTSSFNFICWIVCEEVPPELCPRKRWTHADNAVNKWIWCRILKKLKRIHKSWFWGYARRTNSLWGQLPHRSKNTEFTKKIALRITLSKERIKILESYSL